MASAAEIAVLIKGNASGLNAALGEAQRGLGGLGGAAGMAGKAVAVGLASGVAAAAGIGIASIKAAADFEAGMKEVASLGAIPEDQLKSLSGQVSKLAADMGIDAVDATKTLYDAISSGRDPASVLDFMKTAAVGAVGGLAELSDTGAVLSTIMNSFGDSAGSAEEIMDILNTTVRQGVTTLPELAASFGDISGGAAALGIELPEISALLATVTTKGETTSAAATKLKGAMGELSKPGKDLSAALAQIGFSSGTAAIEALGLQGTFEALGAEADSQGVLVSNFFSSLDAGQAVLKLTGPNAEDARAAIEAMGSSAGNARAAFDTVNESFSRQVELIKGKLAGTLRDVGSVLLPVLTAAMANLQPILAQVTSAIRIFAGHMEAGSGPITAFFGALSLGEDPTPQLQILHEGVLGLIESVKAGIEWFHDLRESLAPLIAKFDAVIGVSVAAKTVLGVVLVGALGALAIAAGSAAVSVIAALAPILIPIAAVSAAVILLRKAWESNWGDIRGKTQTVVDWFKANVLPTVAAMFDGIKATAQGFVSFWEENQDHIMRVVSGAWDMIAGTFQVAIALISGVVATFLAIFRGDWEGAFNAVSTMTQTIVTGIARIMKGLFKTITGELILILKAVPGLAKSIGAAIIDGLKVAILGGAAILGGVIKGLMSGLLQAAKDALSSKSPSKKFIELGEGVVAGFLIGLAGLGDVAGWLNENLAKAINQLDVSSMENVALAMKAIRSTIDDVLGSIQALGGAIGIDGAAVERQFRTVVNSFKGVIALMRDLSVDADKARTSAAHRLNKFDIPNIEAISGVIGSMASAIQAMVDAMASLRDASASGGLAAVFDPASFDAALGILDEMRTALGSRVAKWAADAGDLGVAKAALEFYASSVGAMADILNSIDGARLDEGMNVSTSLFSRALDRLDVLRTIMARWVVEWARAAIDFTAAKPLIEFYAGSVGAITGVVKAISETRLDEAMEGLERLVRASAQYTRHPSNDHG